MKTLEVQLSQDHLKRQAMCSLESAIEEMIWNALDAGGKRVEVRFEENPIGGIEAIEIRDAGSGLPYSDLKRAFGTIGKSLKLDRKRTPDGRTFHGSEGRGRFKALVLGSKARWTTTYRRNGKLLRYEIAMSRADQRNLAVSEAPEPTQERPGTVLRIEDVDQAIGSLQAEKTLRRLTERLALYLQEYPGVRVKYGMDILDPNSLIKHTSDYELQATQESPQQAVLTIIEWVFPLQNKKLLLADKAGFSWHEILAGVQFKDTSYTAYLRFPEAKQWFDEGRFQVVELDAEIRRLIERAKEKLREHVRERLAEEAQDLVRQWKDENVYPYSDNEPQSVVKRAGRQVFDIVASRVHHYHKPFRTGDSKSRQLTLSLVREALENNPTSLKHILSEVLRLPKKQQDDLAELLQDTTLPSIIRAAKEVQDRLKVVEGFDEILFAEEWRKRLLERTQLHRLLVHHLWLFGEEYTLDSDDDRLRTVLEKHMAHLGRELLAEERDPKLVDGKNGIPDLMMSRVFNRDRGHLEHLVVELKRPSAPLGSDEIVQIKKYAHAVARDERFSKTKVAWTFLLVGNAWDAYAEEEAESKGSPYGCLGEHDGYTIWIRRWTDILHEARDRYKFFSSRLEIEVSAAEGFRYLQQNYPALLSGRGLTKKQERQLEEPHAEEHKDD